MRPEFVRRAVRGFAAVLALLALASAARAQLRIMPLGDSITDGDSILHTTYRCNLWSLLENAGYLTAIDFVGSGVGASGLPAVCSLSGTFDQDHEGHSGFKIGAVLAHIQVPANQVSPPADVVLIHMGVTNLLQELVDDILIATGQLPTPQQVLAVVDNAIVQIGLLIDELRLQNPNVTVLLAKIIPASVTFAGVPANFAAVDLYNTKIPVLAEQKDVIGARVFVVDQNSGYVPALDSVDGIHPNASGEGKLAARWFPMVKFVLDSQGCAPATGVTITSDVPVATLCPGDAVTFAATIAGGTGPFLYQWRRDGVAIDGATEPTYALSSITIADDGNYDCVAGNLCSEFTSNGLGVFPLEFAPPVHVAAGAGPVDVIAVDLGAAPDGDLDLAIVDQAGDAVTLLANDGAGGFAMPAVSIPLLAGDAPTAIAAGDLVAGGGVDLAVACPGVDFVRILADTGTWVLDVPIAVPAGSTNPVALVAANLGGGATADLALALEGALFGGGGGLGFSIDAGPALLLPAPPGGFLRVRGVAAADLDGDGDTDLAATMSGALLAPTTTDNVLLYENLGGGSFGYAGALSAADDPRGICAGDFDGDGRLDLAVTVATAPFGAPGGVAVLLHDANPGMAPSNFAAAAVASIGDQPIDVACGDLRDDTIDGFHVRHDLVAANFASANVGLYLGFDGAGFEQEWTCGAGVNPSAVLVAELNGDSTPDVVSANVSSGDVTVSLALPRAQAVPYGAGCTGTNGLIPAISALGTPVYGSTTFAIQLAGGRAFAPTLLGVSLVQANVPLSGCTLLLTLPLVLLPTYTDGAGAVSLTLGIPPNMSPFQGLSAYCQWFVYDPAGAYQAQIAFSNGLRLKFGNP